MKKTIIILLVLLLSTQNLALAFGTSNDTDSESIINNYLIVSSSETWSDSKTITQNVIIAPNANLTISDGAEIQFQGDLIIYGKVQNYGRIDMNSHSVIANYVKLNGMTLSGDSNFQNNGVFDPYGNTANVDCLCLPSRDSYPYPVPPVEITSPMNSKVYTDSVTVKGRTVPGFGVDINGQQTKANDDGTFALIAEVKPGENLLPIKVTDTFGRVHDVQDLQIQYEDDHTPPAAPNVNPLDDTSSTISGSGEANATITVKKGTDHLGETTVGSDGQFSIDIGKQTAGTQLSVMATDQAGNSSEETMITVLDKTGPSIQSTSPASSGTDVLIHSSITIAFDEGIKAGRNFNGITLMNSNNGQIEIEKSISGKNLIIKPVKPLNYTTTYTVNIPKGSVVDSAGNENDQGYKFSFQTEEFSTKVSGGIYEDTTWTKDKNPYIITGDVVVFPDTTLTIDPGVIVKFKAGTSLSLRGKLESKGTEEETVELTSVDENTKSDWEGIHVEQSLGGSVSLEHTIVSHANNGVKMECCSNTEDSIVSSLNVSFSSFKDNETGILADSANGDLNINDSSFIGNTNGVIGEIKKITNSEFDHNVYGTKLSLTESTIYNSSFTNNEYGIYGYGNVYKNKLSGNKIAISQYIGRLKFNTIENNDLGVEVNGPLTISNNEMINNTIGMDIKQTTSNAIEMNTFDNRNWNVQLHTKYGQNLANNYWGAADESLIKEKIYDGYDDIQYGLVKFAPYLTSKVSLEDTTPPTWPEISYLNITSPDTSGENFELLWYTAMDNMEIANYKIYMDGNLLKTVSSQPDILFGYEYHFKVNNLKPGKHLFKVEAGDYEGNWTSDGPSLEYTVKDNEAPVWPDGSSVRVVDKNATSVTLEWTPASDNVKVHEYNIIVNDSWTVASKIPGDTTSYKITGLWPGENLKLKVEAADEAENKAIGPEVNVMLEDKNPPTWSEGAKLTASNIEETSVHLTWPYAVDEYMTEYEVEINGETVETLFDNSYDFTNLSPNTEYTFTVRAKDDFGNVQSQTLSTTIKTPDKTAPIWSEGSSLDVSNITHNSVKLDWPKASDRFGIENYRIKQNGTIIKTLDANTTSYQVTGLAEDTEYEFSVEAKDSSGNWTSNGLSKIAHTLDITPPVAPIVTEIIFINQSTEISGYAEPGSFVEVKENDRSYGSGTTGKDGIFRIVTPWDLREKTLTFTATDLAGNVSDMTKVDGKDLTAPDQPKVNEVTDKAATVTGQAEAGSKVEVKVTGDVIGTGTSGTDGLFNVVIPVQAAGTELMITSTDRAGNVSEAAKVAVKDVTVPAKPQVNEVTDKAATVTGQAEAGAKVEVKVNGNVVGTGTAGMDGQFNVAIPVQKAGTELVIISTDKVGNVSEATKIVVKDVSVPIKPLVNEVTDKNTSVMGQAEAGSIVEVKVNRDVIGTGTTGTDDQFNVVIPVQKAGTELVVTVTDLAGNSSEAAKVVVKDATAPIISKVNPISDQSKVVTGSTEPGSSVTVNIGEQQYKTTTDAKGNFTVAIPRQKAGIKISVIAFDGTNVSKAIIITVLDKTAPSVLTINQVSNKSSYVTGKTEELATVTVTIVTKKYSAKADGKGNFIVEIPIQKAGAKLAVTSKDASGNQSSVKSITVLDKIPPGMPTVHSVSNLTKVLTGKAEAGAAITVTIGTKKYTAKADSKGNFKVTIPVPKEGTKISLTAKDAAGNVSAAKGVTVLDKIAPKAPKISTVVKSSTKEIAGTAEAYSTITVKVGNKVIGAATADKKGKFRVKVKNQKKNTTLYVTAMDKAKNVSRVTKIKVR